jgi:pimeloyl-ACP methyl ester carboxylesterase
MPLDRDGRFIDANGLHTHYLDLPGGDPPIVLLHGLSANAYSFGGLIAAGLSPSFRVVAPDLRGRGRTDKPASGYRMSDHAGDVLALLDALRLERVVLGGHSFGAFLSIYLAAHAPDRVEKLVLIDAAMTLKPQVGEMLKPSLARLARVFPSAEVYLAELQAAPYVAGAWDANIEGYFRAEIQQNEDGTAQSVTSASAIAQALPSVGAEPWRELVERIEQPAILFNAVGPYGPPGSLPLVDPEYAQETAQAFRNCRYVLVPGNHLTLVFGAGAEVIKGEIERFVRG